MDKFSMSVQGAQYCLFAFLALGGRDILRRAVGRPHRTQICYLGVYSRCCTFHVVAPLRRQTATVLLAVIIGLVISSAFSAILVYATDLMPDKVGMIAGVFFGLMFGLGGLGSAFFGWLADKTSVQFVFQISTLLPLLGVVTGFLPNIEPKRNSEA